MTAASFDQIKARKALIAAGAEEKVAEAIVVMVSEAVPDDVVRKGDFADFAKKEDFANFAKKEDFANFVTKEDLANFVTKEDLANFVTKEDLENLERAIKRDFVQLGNRLARHQIVVAGIGVAALSLLNVTIALWLHTAAGG